MTSTGEMGYYRPELLGKYELQYKLENNRIVYANYESLMYMYSLKRNDDADGMWMVCNLFSNAIIMNLYLFLRSYQYS